MILRLFLVLVLVGCNSSITEASNSSEEPNLRVYLNRRMVHRFTDALKSFAPGVDSVLFDLRDNRLDVKVVLQKSQIPFLRFVTPTYKPGEIFKHNSKRKGRVSKDDEEDYLVGFQFSFEARMDPAEPDVAYLAFKQPQVAAYFSQDFDHYRKVLKELGEVLSSSDALRDKILAVNRSLSQLPSGREGTVRKIRLLKEKVTLYEKFNSNTHIESGLQEKVVRFSSGSHLNLLPSDEVLKDLLKAVEGRWTGDGILEDVYQNVKKMQVLHEGLEIKTVGPIKNRQGVLKVSNLGSVLAGYLPGLKITSVRIEEIDSPPPDGESTAAQRMGNYQLVFEGKVPPRGGNR
ncbi:hypothetical protein HOF92_00025 [bacterium]|nr:hypothetical protein [bacterium]